MNRLATLVDFCPEFDTRAARLNPFSPKILQKNYGGGDIGLVGSAAIYAASAIASWAQALLVPGVQAAANILLMNRQKQLYDQTTAVQRQLINTAVNNYTNAIDSLLPLYEDALPDVPLAAQYVPVDACCVQGATIECNISHIERASVFVNGTSRANEQNAITRAIVFDPRWLTSVDMVSMQISDLLRGTLPVGDVVEVLKDRAEQDALSGRIGSSRKTTLRDLGVSKLRAQATGRDEMRRHHTFISTAISPISKLTSIEEMMQTPAQRIALALTQAQLIQNSLQNLYNRNAQKAPYLLAQLETKIQRVITKLQFEANKATLVNTFVPNYAAILQPMVKSVAGAIGDRIEPAAKNLMYGPPGAQDGFTTQGSSSSSKSGISDDESYLGIATGK